MSCQNNANQSTGAAIKCGVSAIANKGAYMAGLGVSAAGGALAGGVVGGLAGTIGGPVGLLIGGTAGVVAGGYLGMKSHKISIEKKRSAQEETRWRQSSIGIKAKQKQDEAVCRVGEIYQPKLAQFKIQKDQTRQEYEQAKATWQAEQTANRPGGVKGFTASPQGKAALATVGQAASAVAMSYLANKALGTSFNVRRTVAGAGLGSVAGFSAQVETQAARAWEASPEGQAATRKYSKKMGALKRRFSTLKAEYERQTGEIKGQYEAIRNSFFTQPVEV